MPTLLERALIATRESRRIELEEGFDFDQQTFRDIAALANSGGGVILFGVNKSGQPVGTELPSVTEAARHHRDLEIGEAVKFGKRLLTAIVPQAPTPIVVDGIVYVRRGARTAPATTEELAKIVQRRVDAARKEWLGAVRRVVREP